MDDTVEHEADDEVIMPVAVDVSEHREQLELETTSVLDFGQKTEPGILGHNFEKTTLKSTTCNICAQSGAPLRCSDCHLSTHIRCEGKIFLPCLKEQQDRLISPVQHRWKRAGRVKKFTFCNICREKFTSKDETQVLDCLGCGMICHRKCQDQVINNCRSACVKDELPEAELRVREDMGNKQHHFVEGNFDTKQACAECDKAINTKACLTGFSCACCDMVLHTECMAKSKAWQLLCTFGSLAPLLLMSHQVVGVDDYMNFDAWHRRFRQVDSHFAASNDHTEQSILIYEGPNVRERAMKFDLDGKKTAATLLARALKQHGIEAVNPKEYFLNCLTYKTKVKLSSIVIDKVMTPKQTRRFPKSPVKTNSGILVQQGITLPPSEIRPSQEFTNFEKRAAMEQGKVKPVQPPIQDSNQHDTSYITINTSKVKPSTRISKLCTLSKRKTKDGSKVALFLRNERYEKYISTGKMPVRLYVGTGVSGSAPSAMFFTTISDNVQSVLAEAKETLRIHEPLDDLFVEQLSCGGGNINTVILKPTEPLIRGPLSHITRHINEHSMRLYIRSHTVQNELRATTMLVTELGDDMANIKDVMTELLEPITNFWELEAQIPNQFAVLLTCNCTVKESDAVALVLRQHSYTVSTMPTIGKIKQGAVPLVALINSKSGGGQGAELLSDISKLLTPYQVFDVTKNGPLYGLLLYRKIPEFRIIVVGGDGTVGWVLNTLDDIRENMECKYPATAVLPVGTGNDLARVLGWGPGYTNEPLKPIITSALLAQPVMMDRWKVSVDSPTFGTPTWTMTNYFGLGLDAYISLGFHERREAHPENFTSRFHNKRQYFQLGAKALLSHPCKHVGKAITMTGFVDADSEGEEIKTGSFEGLVAVNIQSWGSGIDAWGTKKESRFQEPSFNDGKIEVFGIKGISHMSSITGHVAQGVRIGQYAKIIFEIREQTCSQVDGEAFKVHPGTITIEQAPTPQACLLSISKESANAAQKLWKSKPSARSKEQLRLKRSSKRQSEDA
eukprot:m.262095 g.262095  ORF g.262095 m.262095 type:complete len:1015 (-) comp44374_c0_seq1:111-3155(-)